MSILKKKVAATTKNPITHSAKYIVDVLVYTLAHIGDGTLVIFRLLFQVILASFSISKNVWKKFLRLADVVSDKTITICLELKKTIVFLYTSFLPVLITQFKKLYTPKKSQTQKQAKKLAALKKKKILSQASPQLSVQLAHLFTQLRTRLRNVSFSNVSLPMVSRPHFHLPRLKFFKFPRLLAGFSLGIIVTILFVFVPYNLYLFLKLLPNPRALSLRSISVTTQIFDRNGTVLYEMYQDEDRKPIQLAQIPDIVKQATIAIEDKEFYHHPGFSFISIARAARETFFNKQLQGGSTITQQLIKNSLLTPEVTFKRKFLEIMLAFWAERIYSKNEIMEMYLNQVPYGGTAWGIEAAAERYFGKKVPNLNLAEVAYLAGLPAAPTLYSPYGIHPQLAKQRQVEVLHSMYELGYITYEQEETAKNTTLSIKPQINNIKAPHFVMYVRELLTRQYGERVVDQGGLRITTSLDLPTQEKTQEIVTTNIASLQKLRVGNGAAIVTKPTTGEIVAWVGSKDYFNDADHGNVNVVISPRQPGSSIKPVTYAAALEKGLTAATFIDDSPIAYPVPGQPIYAPVNYDGRFHGTVTLRTALASSYNITAVKTLNAIGVKTMIDYGRNMGITTWTDESRFGLALTLGGGEITLYDMAVVYGTLANGGERVDLNPILKITDYTGRVYYERPTPLTQRVITPETSFILSSILSDNQARTPAFGPNSSLVIPGKTVAVKTGTTNEKRDNWTIGYTPSFVVGVWVGNNDNSPMDPYLTSGVTGAAPIWNQIMQAVLKDKSDEPFHETDKLVKIACYGRTEYFVKGTEPKGGCPPLPSPKPTPSPSPN